MENYKDVDYIAVLYLDDGEKNTQLPTAFATKWGDLMRNPLMIKVGDNIERTVQYVKSHGLIQFTEGWSSIEDELKLGRHDVLLFRYNGDSSFDLKCFDAGKQGKTLPPKPTGEFPLNIVIMLDFDQYKEKLKLPYWFYLHHRRIMTNPITMFLDDRSNWQVNWIDVDERICLENGWNEVASHSNIKYGDYLFMVLRGDSEMDLMIVRREAECCAIAQDQIIGVFEEELWKTKITNSKRKSGQPLYIPVRVVKCYFTNKPSNINVVLPSGEIESWSFIWIISSNQGFFVTGWYDFVKKVDLSNGENIRFIKRFGEDNIRDITN